MGSNIQPHSLLKAAKAIGVLDEVFRAFEIEIRGKDCYEIIVEKILYQLEEDLKKSLECSSTEMAIERADTKETYQVYGLLLSACDFRIRGPQKEIFSEVLTLQGNQECLKDNIQKAVILTKDMLTLVPPLLITIVPQVYNEKLHDTNRSTWDESGVNECRELTYYRPILVYGNQLHVATRGLIGNVAPQQPQQKQEQQKYQQHQPRGASLHDKTTSAPLVFSQVFQGKNKKN
ncbi:PREDICTED: uncharacterized protein LOC109586321 [Amphimedon queenslandica]|uniref:Uncharacterized protein n=1 Tax=Amphimedon queenslandica TaxID=400682 RepID=A0AAN0JMQ4_AMPQE|nr:PREDICTED: uncharacterized protein LOC109586321 [Amphimedon queenslandica]|eukprot:XP_019858059.1 PREDICTED: uncharacterized protein LOC109586321 [Amphimedon queenslandica]